MARRRGKRHIPDVEYDEPNPRKRLFIILGVLLVVLVAGGLAAKPAYHWFQHWHAIQLVEASAQALRDRDLKTAAEKADAAMQLWPANVRVARQEAIVLALVKGPGAALLMWMQTWSISHDVGDLREVIEAAIAAGNFSVAVEQFAQLQKIEPQSPATWLLEAKIRLTQNQIPEALAALKKVLDAGNAPPDAYLMYAEAALKSGDPALMGDGLEHLRSLTERTDELGLRALRMLGSYPALSAADADSLAKKLLAHPLATRDDKLLALRLQSQLPGANEESLIKAARDLFPANDPDALEIVGLWLRTQDKYAAVLQLIDSPTAFQRQNLFLLRADSMAALGQWDAIENMLNSDNPKPPLPEYKRLLYEARALTELGHSASAQLAWERARNAVADQPEELLQFGLYAVKMKLDDVARPAFQQLLDHLDQRREAYVQLTQLEHRAGHTAALHQLLLDMAKVYPDDDVVRNDVLYTGFLVGETKPQDIYAARQLVANSKLPYLSFRVTLALGLLESGQAADALKVFDDVTESTWPVSTNAWNAVYVGVLRANGQREKASHIEQYINANDLLYEEKQLLLIPLPPGAVP